MTVQSLQATEATETPVVEEDVFSQAFDDLAAIAAKGEEPPKEAPAAPAAAEAAPADATTEAAAADTTEQTEFTDPNAAAAAAAAAATTETAPKTEPALSDDELVKRLGNLIGRTPAPAPAAPAAPAAPQEAPIVPPPFSTDETAAITQYEADFPDVSRAEQLKRRAENNVLVQHVFREFSKALQTRDEAIQMLLERTQLADIQAAVPSYNGTLRDNVVKWVDQQPSYLRDAYNSVIQSGTAEEVTDLINRYEQANGKPAAAPAATVTQKPAAELPAATKQAVAALAPVGSKRSTVVQGLPQTFEDAFDTFAKMPS